MMNIIAVLDKLANGRQHVVKYRVTVSPTCEGCVVTPRRRIATTRRRDAMAHEQNPEAVMHQVKAELANAYAQEFFTTVRDKCFQKCVTKPGGSMSSGEATCLSRCTDRYVEATKMISHVVLQAYSKGGV